VALPTGSTGFDSCFQVIWATIDPQILVRSRNQIEQSAHTTAGINKINQKIMELYVLFVASIEEQQEIVHRVESLFKIADQLEERYSRAKEYVDKLTQSILAKAFRGELVPQNPNDEPASKLLERIKAERATQTAKRTKNKNKQITKK
jgi:type I restriction enzyme S subunit